MSIVLPKASDYGSRPSLKSNRLDKPDMSGVIMGEALAQAATNITNIMVDKKQKDDRLNYSLAKQEMMTAEMKRRAELKDDNDHETYGERYRTGTQSDFDLIGEKYNLTSSDRALIGAEGEYMLERGVIAVSDMAMQERQIQTRATVDQNLIDTREAVLVEPNADIANEMMRNTIEQLRAAEEESGVYNEQEVLEKIQTFVSSTSTGKLDQMSPEERLTHINLTLGYRKVNGAITIPEIMAGEGTNSLGDFLPTDQLMEMKRVAEVELEQEGVLELAYQATDEAWRQYPQPKDSTKRDAIIAEMTKGNPKARKEAGILHRAKTSSTASADEAGKNDMYDTYSGNMISEGEDRMLLSDISPEHRTYMGAARFANLMKLAENMPERDGFSESDSKEKMYIWSIMPDAEKVTENLYSADWMPYLTRDTWEQFIREKDAHMSGAVSGKAPNIYRGDPDDEALKNLVISSRLFGGEIPKAGTDEAVRYASINAAINRQLVNESTRLYEETGSGYMAPEEILKMTGEELAKQIKIRAGWYTSNDNSIVADVVKYESDGTYTLTAEAKEAYVPIEVWRNNLTGDRNLETGRPQTVEDLLRNLAPGTEDISDEDLEEAYFYLLALPKVAGEAAARARLRGHKDY